MFYFEWFIWTNSSSFVYHLDVLTSRHYLKGDNFEGHVAISILKEVSTHSLLEKE